MPRFFVLSIVILCLLVPGGALLAQGELTLESLNDRLQAVEAKMADLTPNLEARVELLEMFVAEPWSPDAIDIQEDMCQSPLHTEEHTSRGQLRQETADAYRAAFGVSIDPGDGRWESIAFSKKGDAIYIEYSVKNRRVVEVWANCEFLDHSEWTQK